MQAYNICPLCLSKFFRDHTYSSNICRICADKDKIQKSKDSFYKCPQCAFENSEQNVQCVFCEFVFENKLIEAVYDQSIRKKSDLLVCLKCNRSNHISSLQQNLCFYCFQPIYETKNKRCSICRLEVQKKMFQNHEIACFLSRQVIQQEQKMKNDISPQKILQAVKIASSNEKLNQNVNIPQTSSLSLLQKQAIDYMQTKCLTHHNSNGGPLLKRINSLGYKKQDLQNLQYYIQNNAPIIIHIQIKHIQLFIKDTHYRSQFQTNKSSGSLSKSYRLGKEDVMFDQKYKKASNFQRVKYGVVNFTNDPKGVKLAASYGSSYFLLKGHVRERCTLNHKNSEHQAVIATLKYSFAVVNKMTDKQLKAAFNASKAMQQSSSVTPTYKQIQIHGPIQFSKDIERVYVNKLQIKEKKYLNMVYQFCQKNKLEYEFI